VLDTRARGKAGCQVEEMHTYLCHDVVEDAFRVEVNMEGLGDALARVKVIEKRLHKERVNYATRQLKTGEVDLDAADINGRKC